MYYKVQIGDDNIQDDSPDSDSYIPSKLKAIDKKNANAELEKNEVVFSPDGTLKKVIGKTHEQGGVALNLDKDSFIFSDFTKLSIPKEQFDKFGFKAASKKSINNTPAKVIVKEIDIKHHNKMIDITKSKTHDGISKNSAEQMLKKNLEIIGQISYLQEQQKGFPNGVPPFSKDTSPVFTDNTSKDIDQSKQSYKMGGLTKYQKGTWGLWNGDNSPDFKNRFGINNGSNFNGSMDDLADKSGYPSYLPRTNEAWQNWYYNSSPERKSKIDDLHQQYGMPTAGVVNDGYNGIRWQLPANNTSSPTTPNFLPIPGQGHQGPALNIIPRGSAYSFTDPSIPNIGTGEKPGDPKTGTQSTVYNTPLTTWQGFNIAKPLLSAAATKTIYPMRQQQESVIPQVQQFSDQPQINNVNQSYFNAAKSLNGLSPQMAGSYLQQLQGNRIDQSDKITGDIQNQNVTLNNNQKQLAAQLLNTDAGQNRQYDQLYKQGVDTANQRTTEMKDYLKNQSLSTANQYIAENQAFNSKLNSQRQYKTDEKVFNQQGQLVNRTRALYEPTSNGFGYNVNYTPNLNVNFMDVATPADREDYLNTYYRGLGELQKRGLSNIPGVAAGLKQILSSKMALALNNTDDRLMQGQIQGAHQQGYHKFGGKFRSKNMR